LVNAAACPAGAARLFEGDQHREVAKDDVVSAEVGPEEVLLSLWSDFARQQEAIDRDLLVADLHLEIVDRL
jgi:hypothetical protein